MATFYNQATLSFGGRITNSNITEGEIISGITLTKRAVSTNYGPGDGIVYAITLVNADATAKNGITITDDLGAYTLPGSTEAFIPLTYVDGSILYYQNGALQPTPTIETANNLTISGIDVPAGGNVTLLYEARANSFAPLSADSSIFNTVVAGDGSACEPLGDSTEIPTRNEPNLTIAKAVSPAVINCGGEVTYTFIVQNTGNTAVVATDNLTVADTFNPMLKGITVSLNGEELVEGIGYNYNEDTGEFTTNPGAISVPAATYTRYVETGAVTTTPGVAIITVTGMI